MTQFNEDPQMATEAPKHGVFFRGFPHKTSVL